MLPSLPMTICRRERQATRSANQGKRLRCVDNRGGLGAETAWLYALVDDLPLEVLAEQGLLSVHYTEKMFKNYPMDPYWVMRVQSINTVLRRSPTRSVTTAEPSGKLR